MKICASLLCAGLLLVGGRPLFGALVWENPVVELHPKVSDENAVAHFKYKNTGDAPVRITTVRPSCGCTTAAPPADAIAPGASGAIEATFHIGDRMGVQIKTIQVATDPADAGSTSLTLRATVPTVLEMTPNFLFWPAAQPVEPKTIEVKLGGDFPVTKLNVTCTDPDVKAVAEKVPNEKGFRITVTPKPGNRPINATLRVEPDYPKEKPKIYTAYVRIDAHPAAGAPAAAAAAVPPQ